VTNGGWQRGLMVSGTALLAAAVVVAERGAALRGNGVLPMPADAIMAAWQILCSLWSSG
jgi:hypothetical protein